MVLQVFVLRHGETDWTRERRFTGWRDVPLSEAGHRQCQAAARALAPTPLTAVYASPLVRARSSAEAIAAPHQLAVEVRPAFREMGLGQWEGLTRNDVAERFPDLWRLWRTKPERFVAPDGEALVAVTERVADGIAAVRAAHDGESIALVAHGIVNRLIVLEALGLGLEHLWSLDTSPAGITELEYRGDYVAVREMNRLAHLATRAAP